MRIVIHDFSGHPFQMQLSRELAKGGHQVAHWYCSSYVSGKGALSRRAEDGPLLTIVGLSTGPTFNRYRVLPRLRQEVRYGWLLGRRLARHRPDVAVLCNTPLLALGIAAMICSRNRVATVLWQQDIYSSAIGLAARGRWSRAGQLVAVTADRLERYVARSAREVVAISPAFVPTLDRWGVKRNALTVIPNWAPLDELTPGHHDNQWALRHGLNNRPLVLYSGTLGLKHNPQFLLSLCVTLQEELPDARVVVVTEGRGRVWLDMRGRQGSYPNLVLLDYQTPSDYAEVLAASTVLLVLLEGNAGLYSVPSKVLSYLCSGRPVVGLMPLENDAASVLRQSGAGFVFSPGQDSAAIAAILQLLRDADLAQRLGKAGRSYAEAHFAIKPIAEDFQAVLRRAALAG